VPAAIQAVLNEVSNGATHYVTADIRSFFTRVSKNHVLGIIFEAIGDPDFIRFLEKAITVELSNLAELKTLAKDFPTADIGVAQGNSLSPLMGNIVLAAFDSQMNDGDCRCLRYVDDFIILAPSAKAANARLRKAKKLLGILKMELSAEKTSKGAQPINDGFEFLGIEVVSGLIRPSQKSRQKLLSSVDAQFTESRRYFREARNGKSIRRAQSFVATLKRVDGIIDGWGKHYWFCNDQKCFDELNTAIFAKVKSYFGVYRDARERVAESERFELIGISRLGILKEEAFRYPSRRLVSNRATAIRTFSLATAQKPPSVDDADAVFP
jgi:RNA-directed DNA polymerase